LRSAVMLKRFTGAVPEGIGCVLKVGRVVP
jgi:hypothetical protein